MTGKEKGSSGHPNNGDKRLLHIPLRGDEMVESESHMAPSTSRSDSAFSKSVCHA